MPKKWVREARRKAREEAYRTVSAETHAVIREEERAEKTPLPVYRTGPIRWRDTATIESFLRSLLVWADEARGYVINGEIDPKAVPAPASIAAVSALRLAITDWVVRASRVRLVTKHRDAFFINEEFRSNLFLIVTTRITHIGNTSIEMEHEIRLADPRSATQYGELLAIVVGTVIPIDSKTQAPVAMPAAAKEFLTANVLVNGDLPKDVEFSQPNSSLVTGVHSITVRKSDCDAFGHMNNCTAVDFFTDALPSNLPPEAAFFSIEYPSSLKAGDVCSMNWTKWEDEKDGRKHWFWFADLKTGSGKDIRGLKAMFTSYWPAEQGNMMEMEQNVFLPQPFSMDDEDGDEDGDADSARQGHNKSPFDAKM